MTPQAKQLQEATCDPPSYSSLPCPQAATFPSPLNRAWRMATSTSCWPYLPSLKMVRRCWLRTMSWIYKESHGQAVSTNISSLPLPAAPCEPLSCLE